MNRRTSFLAVSVSLTLVLGAPTMFAKVGASSRNANHSTINSKSASRTMTDAEFAKLAAQGGLAEVKLGQLAEDKGTSQAVKDFGKRMVNDHSKGNDALKTAASKANITLPGQITAKDEALYNRLSKLSGAAFDRAYARDMVQDHTADVAAFHHEAMDGKQASIKSFASQTLPTLEEHLKLARAMQHDVSSANSSVLKKNHKSGA
jgi:putative membrane protein